MQKFLAVITGRADRTPLKPVIAALRLRGASVHECNVEGLSIADAASEADRVMCSNPVPVIILGDRYEALTCATVATYHRLPILHIHGGEKTDGSFDDRIRNAITKLASVHFVAHEHAAQRLRDMGEIKNIHITGAPGLDNLTNLCAREVRRHFVVTYHPETAGVTDVQPLIGALNEWQGRPVFVTEPGNDPGRHAILLRLRRAGTRVSELTPDAYIGLCRTAAAVIGNSSSGIIEAPTLEVPTVNIGTRQKGRLCGPSVRTCGNTVEEITASIKWALAYEGPFDNPYGGPGASARIADILTRGEVWYS